MYNEPIDVEIDENTTSFEPSVIPEQRALSRGEVLTTARMVAAAVTGLSALVEQMALQPQARREFVDAWRRWAGTWLGYHYYIERMPFNLEVVNREVAKYAQTLETWRAGLRSEMGAAGVSIGQQSVSTTKPAVVQPQGVFGGWPWWATASVTLGLVYGSYKMIQYTISGWAHRHDDNERK